MHTYKYLWYSVLHGEWCLSDGRASLKVIGIWDHLLATRLSRHLYLPKET